MKRILLVIIVLLFSMVSIFGNQTKNKPKSSRSKKVSVKKSSAKKNVKKTVYKRKRQRSSVITSASTNVIVKNPQPIVTTVGQKTFELSKKQSTLLTGFCSLQQVVINDDMDSFVSHRLILMNGKVMQEVRRSKDLVEWLELSVQNSNLSDSDKRDLSLISSIINKFKPSILEIYPHTIEMHKDPLTADVVNELLLIVKNHFGDTYQVNVFELGGCPKLANAGPNPFVNAKQSNP